MRVAFFSLLFANLAFLAWSAWIDAPQPATANDVYAKLPRLKLVGEDTAAGGAAASPSSTPPSPSAGKSRKTSLQGSGVLTASSLGPSEDAAQCLSLGPFEDEAGATRAVSALREKGFSPRSRLAPGLVSKGFWVYIGDLRTDRDVTQVLHTLEQSHVDDAKVMQDSPSSPDSHRVSVGIFSDRDRADRRVTSVSKLGLTPQVAERKLPGTLTWVDFDVPPGSAPPSTPDLLSDGVAAGSSASSARVAVSPCPASATPSSPSAAPLAPAHTPAFRTKVATGSAPHSP